MAASKTLIFERSTSERYLIDYADRVGLVIIAVLYLAGIVNGIAIKNADKWFGTLPFILLIIFLYGQLFRRFAYKVSIDLKRNEYTFFMFRKGGIITTKRDSVTKIYLNFFITFFFNGKKVIYTGVDEKQLVRLLKSEKQISCGRFWNITSRLHKKN